MSKKFVFLSLIFLIVACGNKNNDFSNNNDSLSSDLLSSSDNSYISNDNSSILDEKIENKYYDYHPFSEPNINQQLPYINPLGNINEVWNYYRGDNVVVAVIDSGFDYEHPEFKDSNGNSSISDKSAYIYTSNNDVKINVGKNNVGITDGDSHGTMCAGLIGSNVNGVGITGIAPNVELMLIKIDKKATSMAEAFKYAADNGAQVISTSLGAYPSSTGATSGDIIFEAGYDLSSAFTKNINYAHSKGVTIVAATGNSKTTELSYPAGCDNVIGAGGLNANSITEIWDNGYEGSNYNGNNVYVDVFAPSAGIYAPGYDASSKKSTYWSEGKGTSFASPLIAGAIALYIQKYPNTTNVQIEKALQDSCVDISSFNNNKNMGWGRLDISNFLNIEEDILQKTYDSSSSIEQKATKLTIVDEAGWNFRTLHLFNITFEKGYGFKELELYFDRIYGRLDYDKYQLEGTIRGYTSIYENFVGDYLICLGNKDDGVPTNYEYIFPWWVKDAYYQIVNNHNWIEEGGINLTSKGYCKDIKTYFWYKNNQDTGVSQVIYEDNKHVFDAITVNKVLINNNQEINSSKIIQSVFDYYEPNGEEYKNMNFKGWFLDRDCTIPYYRNILTCDTTIYGLIV